METDPELSVSQTLRSDQPIHGGDRQTFEMETLFMNPFVSHWLALSNPGRPAIISVPLARKINYTFSDNVRILSLAAASDKVYQLLVHGRWFTPVTPASSTTKLCRHDMAEILLKVALSTINQIKSNQIVYCLFKSAGVKIFTVLQM